MLPRVKALLKAVDDLIDQLAGDKTFCVYCGEELTESWGACTNEHCSYPPLRKALADIAFWRNLNGECVRHEFRTGAPPIQREDSFIEQDEKIKMDQNKEIWRCWFCGKVETKHRFLTWSEEVTK